MRNTIAKDLRTPKYAKKVVASKKHYTRKLKHKGNQIMKNYVKILAVSAVALSLGACNVATIAPMAGAGLGGAGGGALGSQFGKGKGKLIATGIGALLGAFGGYNIINNRSGGSMSNYGCSVRNNYVVCNSNQFSYALTAYLGQKISETIFRNIHLNNSEQRAFLCSFL